MRQYIETCLRGITGFQGKFSDEMELFWRTVQFKYNACSVPMMPQEHIPIWWHEAQRQCIPLEYVVKEKPAEVPQPSPPAPKPAAGKTRAQTAGV